MSCCCTIQSLNAHCVLPPLQCLTCSVLITHSHRLAHSYLPFARRASMLSRRSSVSANASSNAGCPSAAAAALSRFPHCCFPGSGSSAVLLSKRFPYSCRRRKCSRTLAEGRRAILPLPLPLPLPADIDSGLLLKCLDSLTHSSKHPTPPPPTAARLLTAAVAAAAAARSAATLFTSITVQREGSAAAPHCCVAHLLPAATATAAARHVIRRSSPSVLHHLLADCVEPAVLLHGSLRRATASSVSGHLSLPRPPSTLSRPRLQSPSYQTEVAPQHCTQSTASAAAERGRDPDEPLTVDTDCARPPL